LYTLADTSQTRQPLLLTLTTPAFHRYRVANAQGL